MQRLFGIYLFFSALTCSGQYLDSSMTWVERESWANLGLFGWIEYELSLAGDSSIDGILYQHVWRTGLRVDSNESTVWGWPDPPIQYTTVSNSMGFVRESGDTIFFRPSSNEPEWILYDFGMEVGDSVGSFDVLTVDSVTFNGQNRKRYWTNAPQVGSYVLEGVGHTYGGFLSPGILYIHSGRRLLCAGTESMNVPYPLDSLANCEISSSVTLELPCSVSDSLILESGSGTKFIFLQDTLDYLLFDSVGIYQALVIDSIELTTYPLEVNVIETEPEVLSVDIQGDLLICPGDTLFLCAEQGQVAYQWLPFGMTSQCVQFPFEDCFDGIIQVHGFDELGCTRESDPILISCGDTVESAFDYQPNGNMLIGFTSLAVNADSVFWDFGDGTSSTQLNPVHQFSDSSSTVCLVAWNDCDIDTSCQQISTLVGTGEQDDPLTIQFFLRSDNLIVKTVGRYELELTDLKGSLMFKQQYGSGETARISTESFSSGPYALRIHNFKGETIVHKVVVP